MGICDVAQVLLGLCVLNKPVCPPQRLVREYLETWEAPEYGPYHSRSDTASSPAAREEVHLRQVPDKVDPPGSLRDLKIMKSQERKEQNEKREGCLAGSLLIGSGMAGPSTRARRTRRYLRTRHRCGNIRYSEEAVRYPRVSIFDRNIPGSSRPPVPTSPRCRHSLEQCRQDLPRNLSHHLHNLVPSLWWPKLKPNLEVRERGLSVGPRGCRTEGVVLPMTSGLKMVY